MRQKISWDGRKDRQTDRGKTVYPLRWSGGIKSLTVMVKNSPNISKTNNHYSPHTIEYKKKLLLHSLGNPVVGHAQKMWQGFKLVNGINNKFMYKQTIKTCTNSFPLKHHQKIPYFYSVKMFKE